VLYFATACFLKCVTSGSGDVSNAVDILCNATSSPCEASATTTALPTTTSATASPDAPDVPFALPPASPIPTFITAGAVMTSGHVPRVLELVQFLSIFCTSLSLKQQSRLSEFQISSLTHITSKKEEQCSICPGSCTHPLVLVMPIFVLVTCLFSLGVVVILFDWRESRKCTVSPAHMHDRLLDSDAVASAKRRSSLLRTVAGFCFRYFRSVIETSSSYMLMPSTFVFVLNLRASSFSQASLLDRTMIIATPGIALLFRTLVIRQRVVHLSPADQKQLYAGSLCSCAITVIFGVYFNQVDGNGTQSTVTSPLYIALAVLATQLIAQTVIRAKASEASIFDSNDWPWSAADSESSSAVFSFQVLPARLAMNSIKSASLTAAIVVVKFLVLNYVVVSQAVLIVLGLASSGVYSESSLNTYSIAIGCIPLASSGAMLLQNAVKFIVFLKQKMLKSMRRADPDRSFRGGCHSFQVREL
jgi:hypothetical protein